MVAYLGGPEVTLSSLVLKPEHSLLVQSYAPKEMMSGVVNADGFGVGWYAPEIDEEPALYRSGKPLWADKSFESISARILSRTIFAAVRSATPGLPVEESGVPPFASGRFMFTHNGAIEDFRRTAMRPLRDALSDEAHAGLLGVTDSETIFAVLLDRLSEDPGDLPKALMATVHHVADVCEELSVKATLNLAATDGETMAFTRHSTEGPGNSLYLIDNGKVFPDAVIVASERLDGDPGWRQVPDRHLLSVNNEHNTVLSPL